MVLSFEHKLISLNKSDLYNGVLINMVFRIKCFFSNDHLSGHYRDNNLVKLCLIITSSVFQHQWSLKG